MRRSESLCPLQRQAQQAGAGAGAGASCGEQEPAAAGSSSDRHSGSLSSPRRRRRPGRRCAQSRWSQSARRPRRAPTQSRASPARGGGGGGGEHRRGRGVGQAWGPGRQRASSRHCTRTVREGCFSQQRELACAFAMMAEKSLASPGLPPTCATPCQPTCSAVRSQERGSEGEAGGRWRAQAVPRRLPPATARSTAALLQASLYPKRTSPVVQMRSAYAFLGSLMQLVVMRMGPGNCKGAREGVQARAGSSGERAAGPAGGARQRPAAQQPHPPAAAAPHSPPQTRAAARTRLHRSCPPGAGSAASARGSRAPAAARRASTR